MTGVPDVQRIRPRMMTVVLVVAFGLLYAYDLWEAVSNLVGVSSQLSDYNKFLIENDVTPLAIPWPILIANLLLPPVAFACAWWTGRRHTLLVCALLYLLGLAVVAALTLSLTSML